MLKKLLPDRKTHPAVITACFIVIIAGIMQAQAMIAQGLMSLFIGIICVQPIRWMESKKVPQGLAIAIVLVAMMSLFFGFGGLIGGSLTSFSKEAPQYADNLKEMGDSMITELNSHGIEISTDEFSNIINPGRVMSMTAGFLGQLGGFMGNALTIFFLVLFLLLEMDSIVTKIRAVVSDEKDTGEYLGEIMSNIRNYLSIKTLTSLMTGILIWVALLIIGVDYAILWALIAFLLNYIPNIGSILAALPAVLFSVIQLGPIGALWTTVVFVAVNMAVGNVVEPKMMGKGLGLSTFIIFFALIFWGFVLGTIGMFLSVPLTMIIKIILAHNPKTKSIAVFLGSELEAQMVLDEKNGR